MEGFPDNTTRALTSNTFTSTITFPTTAAFMPLQARLEQLEAAVKRALDRTDGITSYPPETPGLTAPPRDAGIIATVDLLNELMAQINGRLDRIKEVIGGPI